MPSPSVLISDIILGLITALKDAENHKAKKVKDEHYKEVVKYQLQGVSGTSAEFKDYAPAVFDRIRKKYLNITTEDYLKSWHVPEQAELTQSAGRSGSLFYKTTDKRFLFKTILHPEVGVMLSVLKDYYHYLATTKHLTYIMRVVGLHRIAYGTEKTWVLVFSNSLPINVRLDDVFDLKGRKPKPGKSFKERGRVTPEQNPKKDNELDRGLVFLRDDQRQHYIDQVNQDVQFLAKHNLMDYSLLVGVHIVNEAAQTDPEVPAKENDEPSASKDVQPEDSSDLKSSNKKKKDSNKSNASPVPSQSKMTTEPAADDVEKKSSKKSKSSKQLKEQSEDAEVVTEEHSEHKKEKKSKKKDKSKADENPEDSSHEGSKHEKKSKKAAKKEERKSEGGSESDDDSESSSEYQSAAETSEEQDRKPSRSKKTRKHKKKVHRHSSNLDALAMAHDNMDGSVEGKTPRKSVESVSEEVEVIAETKPKSIETIEELVALGGLLGRNPRTGAREIYFIGIIDCLTSFVLKKKVAYMFKQFKWSKSTLSTVDADYYGHRFSIFMTQNLLTDGDISYKIKGVPDLPDESDSDEVEVDPEAKTDLKPTARSRSRSEAPSRHAKKNSDGVTEPKGKKAVTDDDLNKKSKEKQPNGDAPPRASKTEEPKEEKPATPVEKDEEPAKDVTELKKPKKSRPQVADPVAKE